MLVDGPSARQKAPARALQGLGLAFGRGRDDYVMRANKKIFHKFIEEFQEGNFSYKYRDALKRNYLR